MASNEEFTTGPRSSGFRERRMVGAFGIPYLKKYLADHSVRRDSGCLEWVGTLNREGYGQLTLHRQGKCYGSMAHRLSFVLYKASVTPGLTLDHTCGNRSCIEPLHLDECSMGENVRRSEKSIAGRNARKTHCPQGHPLIEGNLVLACLRNGQRSCLTCSRARTVAGNERRKLRLMRGA